MTDETSASTAFVAVESLQSAMAPETVTEDPRIMEVLEWARAKGKSALGSSYKLSALDNLRDMDKALKLVGKSRADIGIAKDDVLPLVEGALDYARSLWKSATGSNKQYAHSYVLKMDEALELVDKTRADIGITDDNVREALVEGTLDRARFCWERVSNAGKESTVYWIRGMDATLELVDKTRADIGITDEDVRTKVEELKAWARSHLDQASLCDKKSPALK